MVGASRGGASDARPPVCNGLLDPIQRIIQKMKVFDVEWISHEDTKKANRVALEYFREEIRDEYIRSFKKYNVIERWLSPVDELNRLLLRFSCNAFRKYRFHLEETNRFIFVESVDDEKDLIELDNRYCTSYQEKIIRRARYLGWRYRGKKSVLLTLTIDPQLYGHDKFLMWQDIKKQYNRFITNIKYYFKKTGAVFPPYVCSIEAQKNGNPHLHICFLGAGRLMDWRRIRDIWHLGHIFINRDRDNRKIRNPVNYLMKYISKTYTDTNEKNELTQTLCWLFNIRSYQCSRGLISPLKPKPGCSEWFAKYLIIVNDSVPVSFLYLNLEYIGQFFSSSCRRSGLCGKGYC